jgi:hypothetical protein
MTPSVVAARRASADNLVQPMTGMFHRKLARS